MINKEPLETPLEHNLIDGRNLNNLEEYWVKYRGDLYEGKRQGMGELSYLGGFRYKGEFEDGVAEGKGIFYYKDTMEPLAGIWHRGVFVEESDR